MGLASQFGWTGVNDFIDPRRNTLMGLGAGLLSGNLGNAGLYAMKGKEADDAYATSQKAEAERQQQIHQTASFIAKTRPDLLDLPIDKAWGVYLQDRKSQPDKPLVVNGQVIDPQTMQVMGDFRTPASKTAAVSTEIQNYEYGLNHPGFAEAQTQRGGQTQTALNPIWGQDANGNPVLGQLNSKGEFVQTALPDGVKAMGPGDVAGAKATGTVDAKTAGAARAALPGAQQAVDIANKAANALLSDQSGMSEQFGNTLGFPNQNIPSAWPFMQPGSNMARFRTELAQGQGQAFMQARQMLKGGGPITDFEGAKAEAAFSRMQLAAQNNSKDEFTQAVQDFQQAVNEGYQKLQAAAQGDYAAGGPGIAAGAPAAGNQTSTGIQWSYSP
jgi:hypothetical protein